MRITWWLLPMLSMLLMLVFLAAGPAMAAIIEYDADGDTAMLGPNAADSR